MYYLSSVSLPEVVEVKMTKTIHSSNNTVTYVVSHVLCKGQHCQMLCQYITVGVCLYQVSLWEKSSFIGQFGSGYSAASVDVNIEVNI